MPAIVKLEKCDGCGSCVEVCPTESITVIAGKAHVDPEDCIDCEACIDACPHEAIAIVDEEQVQHQGLGQK